MLFCPEAFPPRLARRFQKYSVPFYTQPGCRLVFAVLLGGGVFYALLLLFLVPAPSKLRWGLVLSHSTRLLNVLVALYGEGQSVTDAAVELAAHVPDASGM